MSDEFKSPPDIKNVVIDEEIFHPLMHSLRECKGWPGGRRQHLRLQWEYQWDPWVCAHTWCLIGRHHSVQWFQRDRETGVQLTWKGCHDCGKRLSEKQPV